MYFYEERIKAVKLYIKYDLSISDKVWKLGYPNRKMLVRWHKEYQIKEEIAPRVIWMNPLCVEAIWRHVSL